MTATILNAIIPATQITAADIKAPLTDAEIEKAKKNAVIIAIGKKALKLTGYVACVALPLTAAVFALKRDRTPTLNSEPDAVSDSKINHDQSNLHIGIAIAGFLTVGAILLIRRNQYKELLRMSVYNKGFLKLYLGTIRDAMTEAEALKSEADPETNTTTILKTLGTAKAVLTNALKSETETNDTLKELTKSWCISHRIFLTKQHKDVLTLVEETQTSFNEFHNKINDDFVVARTGKKKDMLMSEIPKVLLEGVFIPE